MTGPYPTPQQAYEQLPYRFPLVDAQPVVRIPVAGPAPFDTVAVVRTVVGLTTYGWAGGEVERQRLTLPTPLLAPGAVGGPAPVHSSSATLRMMQISAEQDFVTNDDNTDFVLAVDSIDPVSGFDEHGRWHVTVEAAASVWQVFAGATAEVSSWVLFREGRRDAGRPIDWSRVTPLPWRPRFDPVGWRVPVPVFRPKPPSLRVKRPRGPRRPTG